MSEQLGENLNSQESQLLTESLGQSIDQAIKTNLVVGLVNQTQTRMNINTALGQKIVTEVMGNENGFEAIENAQDTLSQMSDLFYADAKKQIELLKTIKS